MNKFLWLIFVAIGVAIYKVFPAYNIPFFTIPELKVSLAPCLAVIGLVGLIKSAFSHSA